MSTVTERVAAGAAFLDEVNPGWDSRIDVDRLNLDSCANCVLGQLYGSFGAGLRETELLREDDDRDTALGFFWGAENCTTFEESDALAAEWKRVIIERRAPVTT